MDIERPRVRWPFLVALALAVCGSVARYTLSIGAATARRVPQVLVLDGVTGQGTRIQIGVQGGRVRFLHTSLNARCRGGPNWHEKWDPAEGAPVHFKMTGRSFVTDERADPSYPDGVVGRIAFVIDGTLNGRGNTAGQGTIRLVGRFYRGEREWNACDSLDVAWAVGRGARGRLGTVALGQQIGEYFPAVPSLAVDSSPARRSFIARVDETCLDTYRLMTQAEDDAAAEFRREHVRNAALLNDAYYVELHTWQLRELIRLGPPPEAPALYDAWLSNFRRRVLTERRALFLRAHHRFAASNRVEASVGPLKTHGNLLGQQFGLVRCTSNGDRTPIPILSDGQPLPLL